MRVSEDVPVTVWKIEAESGFSLQKAGHGLSPAEPYIVEGSLGACLFSVQLAVEPAPSVGDGAGYGVQVCIPSQLLLFCHLHCFIPVRIQKTAGKAADTPGISSVPQPSVSVSNK